MEYSDEFKRDDVFWNWVGMVCGVGMIVLLIMIFATLISAVNAEAGELDAWEFNVMGITSNDFDNRDWKMMVVGVVSSLAVHEIGHLASAKLMGSDPHFSWSDRVAYAGDGYNDWSDDQKALFSAAGFIAQTVTGSILTAIPSLRHSDFTLGFNTFSSINGFYYGITDGAKAESSDTVLLDYYGYNGTAIALTSGVANGVLTYISLDKSDD